MKALQRFEKIVDAVRERIQEEVSSLIGEQLALDLLPGSVLTKEDFFNQPLGKLVLARIDLSGEVEGKGALIVSVKDAIRLGGTLIMLPPTELEDVVGNERYDGETEDSYGEIANIIAGSYTKAFEEMYPKACRFVRKEQQVVIPLKVDAASEEPIPDQQYYQVAMEMQLDQRRLGSMYMLVPAEAFGLAEKKEAVREDQGTAPAGEEEVAAAGLDSEPLEEQAAAATTAEAEKTTPEKKAAGSPLPVSSAALEKLQKQIDALLNNCSERVGEEVGALLGVAVNCGSPEHKLIGKEAFFFEEATGKQVVAELDVVGDREDKSFLFVGLKDAIRIGGTLIMLPPSELETAIGEEDFGADSQDAYGEIANIIAGVYTAVFEEQYTQSLRFIKKDIEQVVPMKVDIESDLPIPDLPYYLSSMRLRMGGKEYGRLQMLFPARLLGLEALGQEAVADDGQLPGAAATEGGSTDSLRSGPEAGKAGSDQAGGDVLLVSDSEPDAKLIRQVLDDRKLTWRQVSFKDNLKKHLPGEYQAVFLVMKRVDEQGFGMAIKISSKCSLPIIAAGPEWTRTKVMRAVKYGVTDILLTPADQADVAEKIENNIFSKAA